MIHFSKLVWLYNTFFQLHCVARCFHHLLSLYFEAVNSAFPKQYVKCGLILHVMRNLPTNVCKSFDNVLSLAVTLKEQFINIIFHYLIFL